MHVTDVIARWRNVPTAIVADVSTGLALIDPAIRPLRVPGQQPRLFGRAVTARCVPPDFGAVLRALDLVKPGDVLVIDAQGHRDHAMIGGILGGFLHRKGAAGIVCDGAVRDVAELAAFDGLSVYARAITPRGPTAAAAGSVNGPVNVGGRSIASGDLIIGDDDGLVSLTPDMISALIDQAEAKMRLEEDWIAKLKSGQSIATTFGLS
jgi:4-hydroxy-4-methyl-2-oxoglutarate aldolase